MYSPPSFENAIRFAQDLIRIPGLPGDEKNVADRVLAEYAALGFDDYYRDEAGSCIAIVKGRGEKPAVMLSSHLDVVDVGDADSWEYPPFSGIIADGHLHGRGAMDIKGPLALQTYAAAQFLEERPAGDIVVAHTVLEERGGWGMQHIMEAGRLRPGAVIIGEATSNDVCIGHRGRAEFVLEIEGVAGHASAPERARNPIDVLPLLLSSFQLLTARQMSAPLLGAATIAPTAIETRPTSRNVIPDRVRVVVDWRIVPGPSPDEILELLRLHFHEHLKLPAPYKLHINYSVEPQQTYTGMKRDRRLFTPGFLMAVEHAVVSTAVRTISEQTGRQPAIRPWAFATDGGHTCGVHGIPTIGFAPGEERYAHTNRERLELNQARIAYDAYPHLVRAVQAVI